ncbi:MAG: amino acid carrier protein [Flavobacteriaceae bacterium]|nr:amino acid carrier protein [Flavobacteriaceae bacterium]
MNQWISSFETILKILISPLEWIMLFAVIGGGLFLLFHSKGYPFLKIKTAFQLLFSKEENNGISRFQALSAVLAATVGLGNISGVAIAIHQGGPGVLVWMWVTAAIGMIIKFYSCTLAVQLRETDEHGDPLGGPMYYMKIGMKKWGKSLAVWFSVAGLFGVLPAFTANQLTQTFINVITPDSFVNLSDFQWKLIVGVVLSIASASVIYGGLKSIVKVTSNLVPAMVGLYFLMGVYILVANIEAVLPAFNLIFSEAFNFQTMVAGGFWGLVILGVRRAVFSNESGVGNAPMYHGQSQSKKGTDEGLVAMLGPLLDTVLVCTITGLIVIISGAYLVKDLNGIVLTLEAFRRLFFGFGDQLLLIMVFVFGISTLFTYSYYGVKCFGFLTKNKWGNYYNYFYIGSIIFSALVTVEVVIGIIDLSFALMCIPNMIAILYLSRGVKKEMQERNWIA